MLCSVLSAGDAGDDGGGAGDAGDGLPGGTGICCVELRLFSLKTIDISRNRAVWSSNQKANTKNNREAGPQANTQQLLALDFEKNGNGLSMK